MAHPEHGSVLLSRYLAGPPKRSQTDLAERVGKTQQTISRWKSGEDEPTDLDTQLKLEQATDGEVPVESWLSEQGRAALDAKLDRRSELAISTPVEA